MPHGEVMMSLSDMTLSMAATWTPFTYVSKGAECVCHIRVKNVSTPEVPRALPSAKT